MAIFSFLSGNTASFSGFLRHFLRQEYGSFNLAQEGTSVTLTKPVAMTEALWRYALDFQSNTLHFGIPMVLIGVATLWLGTVRDAVLTWTNGVMQSSSFVFVVLM